MSQESLPKKNPVVDEDDKNKKAIVSDEEAVVVADNANYYIDAALRSSRTNEVFVFCDHEYVVITYDPTSPGKGRVVRKPILLCDGFPTLYNSDHRFYGVDAAFGCHSLTEAYLFVGRSCTKIEYGPNVRVGNVLGYSRYIKAVFPCLETVGFHCSIDAAFESTVIDEAYLFKGSKYALLNHAYKTLIRTGLITDEFPCLLNTKFASDIRAAFASHSSNQAYLFKNDNSYVVIQYTPGKPNDSYIVWGPEETVPSNWPALQGIVPFKKYPCGAPKPTTWSREWRDVDGGWYAEMEDSDGDLFGRSFLHTADIVPPSYIPI